MNRDDNNHVKIILSRADWKAFQVAINKLPAEPSAELKRLMASSAPWDNKKDS